MKKFIFVILFLLTLSGCKTLEVQTADGMIIKYNSYGDSSIESIYFEKTSDGMKAKITNSTQTEQDLNVSGIGDIE